MINVNKVIMAGKLTRDPELVTIRDKPLCKFTIEVIKEWKNDMGETKSKTGWFNIDVWGKSAQNCNKYLKKDREVYVEGELQIDMKEDNGIKRYFPKINAQIVKYLSTNTPKATDRATTQFDTQDIPF